MKVIVIGAAGTIGRAIADALDARHQVVRVGRRRGDRQADITSKDSILALYEAEAPFHAVVCAAGEGRFKDLDQLTDEDFAFTITNKLMGQVNLVRYGIDIIEDGGSFTLTSGVLAASPMRGGAALSLVNGGLEAFARAAALEAPRGIRVNVVSPPWVSETLVAMGQPPEGGLPAAQVAAAYVAAVDDAGNGQVLDPKDFAA
jgi:NAD(P)-dependent dehydrogenase (short-subunit alcohol dehydrogenase family)